MRNILIAGGDMRQICCSRRLSEKYETSVIGFDGDMLPDDMSCGTGKEKYGYAVLPVLPLDDNGDISTPCFSGSISAEQIKSLLAPDAVIFAGRANERLHEMFRGHDILDYMEREELSLRNAVPTAEGAVQIALEELPVTLSGLKVLIAGMGRIGTALSVILKGFGADVTAAVRNTRGAAKAALIGVEPVYMNDVPSGFGLVFNTVPSMIFGREELSRFGRDTLFIDLASKPGGIDMKAAQEMGMKVIWALGLPGKTAPVTAGEIIADTIGNMISEREDDHVR